MEYINGASYEMIYREWMKRQERIMIRAYLHSKTLEILRLHLPLSLDLKQSATAMKNYASHTYANNIKEGFQGSAAESANTYLTQTLTTPDLKNPIR
ncbi:hypothetical protein [Streptococcus marimammalium]|uniref:hypothetical protein n=1 Tax=Streptococcus marimammalium TaxID=269666 RepID=UPI00037E400D|nr:hypothetical protein [Streptococcus marimammalium]